MSTFKDCDCGYDKTPMQNWGHYYAKEQMQMPENFPPCEPTPMEPVLPLAMAYVPWQHFSETYDLCKALQVGTIFPDLNLPFCGRRGK